MAAPLTQAAPDGFASGRDAASLRYDFDIPALPLVQALDRYAMLTNRPALFSSDMVAGRISSQVRGRYSPEAGLMLLLEGTGLRADISSTGPTDAFVLAPVDSHRAKPAGASAFASYVGLLQSYLWGALCGDRLARPGNYRVLLRFEVDRSGSVRRVRLLGSTGDMDRDRAVRVAAERVSLSEPPPQGMPQPVTMLILPDESTSDGVSTRCASREP
ncbi:Outer membrane receptor for ferric coprogen and ferric-rhodotorulic acid [Bordetella ansorpii]|uniref:Outer membrane receptor for ferric coprogen and ferric-rhodotorulic acid n=1 Tax=Bordetella ansorpii TaxID=288768 RepID=A0A157QKP2_9BORD|nr:TonB family protein [Bordetella ansorpii]SAI46184.1 Outer membrane receptor for ferric coprogen and ferric-rhodotorulic acid [Bordetella ansorpii]